MVVGATTSLVVGATTSLVVGATTSLVVGATTSLVVGATTSLVVGATTSLHFKCLFKCLYSPCPTYLSQLFPTPNSSYHTRFSSSSQLNLPAVRSSYCQRAFSFAGASMWRSLPATTRQMRDFQAFSAKCKDLLI